jgi:hypothetical protein
VKRHCTRHYIGTFIYQRPPSFGQLDLSRVQKRFAKERCIRRESNPSQLLGRQLSYRWTTEATGTFEGMSLLEDNYYNDRDRYVYLVDFDRKMLFFGPRFGVLVRSDNIF